MKKRQKKHGKRQQGLLRRFWDEWYDQKTNRLELLRVYADQVCKLLPSEDVQYARRKFNRAKHASLGVATEGICQCCYRVGPRVWHHVIQIQHGGIARRENLVLICESCHAKIHAWLEQKLTQLLPDEAYKPFWS